MSRPDTGLARRFWLGLVCIAAVIAAWGAWVRRVQPGPVRTQPTQQPFLRLVGVDQVLRDRADLLDPTPLFFPTPWNYGQQPLAPEKLKQPGQVFANFKPQFPLIDKGIGTIDADSQSLTGKLADLLAPGNEAPFAGFGRIDKQRATLPVRQGFLEIHAIDNSDVIKPEILGGISPPKPDIAPVEFLVTVGAAGLIGEPILTGGSGWDEVDNYFSNYLVRTYRLGQRLRPGRYRVIVGS